MKDYKNDNWEDQLTRGQVLLGLFLFVVVFGSLLWINLL